jgi:peroxiredoxin
MTPSVQDLLDDLQAARNAEWSPQRLAEHAEFRRSLVDGADRSRIVKAGDRLPPVTLVEVDEGPIDLDARLAAGPVVLVFFRFDGCPACNAALRGYQLTLAPVLRDLGAQLIAVSAQVPDRLVAIKRRHGLGFAVASDPGHALIEAFGLGFDSPGAAELLGTQKSVFPYPAVVVVDRHRVVRFADVTPDWMVRTPVEPVIDAVRALLVSDSGPLDDRAPRVVGDPRTPRAAPPGGAVR